MIFISRGPQKLEQLIFCEFFCTAFAKYYRKTITKSVCIKSEENELREEIHEIRDEISVNECAKAIRSRDRD